MKTQDFYTVVWENDMFLAVNKVSGIVVCPERWERAPPSEQAALTDQSLPAKQTPLAKQAPLPQEQTKRVPLNRLLEETRGGRFFVCHRIDRETSGLVVFAKTPEAHKRLSAAFEKRLVPKKYVVILHGRPLWKETVCDLPLLPNGNKKHGTIVDKYRGKPSQTLFRLLFSAGSYTVAEAEPHTGRTHQIRVHAAALGHPVVCDALYGPGRRSGTAAPVCLSAFKRGWRGDTFEERPLLARLGLHAAALTLPVECGVSQPWPLEAVLARDMAATITQIEKCG